MKIITELIDYFISTGELDEFDLRYLEKQGFYRRTGEDYVASFFEDEGEVSPNRRERMEEEAENEAWNEAMKPEVGKPRKGMGSRSRSQTIKARLTFEDLNQLILAKIAEWEKPLQPLLALTGLPNEDAIECLKRQEAAGKEQLPRKLRERMLRQPYKFTYLKTALFFTGHLEFVFSQLDQLPPKKRGTVRRWLLDHAPANKENREGFRFILHCVRLQRAALLVWAELHEELLHTGGYPGTDKRMDNDSFSQLALAFLLLQFSEPLLPVQTVESPVYYLFKNEDLETVFAFFLTLFPRRYHYFYQNMRRAWLPKGTTGSGLGLRHHLAWMPPPAWVRLLSGGADLPLALDMPLCRLSHKSLKLESDWFTIAGMVDIPTFFTSAAGFAVCERGYREIQPMQEGSAIVRLYELVWGAVDRHGKFVFFKEKLRQVWSFREGLARVELDGNKDADRFCFFDKNGVRALQGETFAAAEDFSEGLACVAKELSNGELTWFYVDASGNAFHQFFKCARSFHEGKAPVQIDSGWTYIDKTGKFIGEKDYDDAWHFREDRAVVRQGWRYGCIDGNGDLVARAMYEWIWSFNEGKTAALLEDEWFHIDLQGWAIGKLGYALTEHFSEGLAGCYDSEGFYFVDAAGKVVYGEARFAMNSSFRNGLALVRQRGRGQYFIDREGRPQFAGQNQEYRYPFSEGYTPVFQLGKFAIMDAQGNLCSDFVFQGEFARHFDGLARFERERKEEFPEFEAIPYTAVEEGVFSEGTAILKKPNGSWHLVFKSDFREQSCERVEVICYFFQQTEGQSPEFIWRMPESKLVLLADFEIRSAWKLDGGRLALEDASGRIAVVNWAETLKKMADEPL